MGIRGFVVSDWKNVEYMRDDQRTSPTLEDATRRAIEAGSAVPLLGLPGNPVSAMVSFEMFVRPAILKMLGRMDLERPTVEAMLMDEVRQKDGRRHFLRVRVEESEGEYRAYLTGGQGLGILSSMVKANGFAIIPEEWTHVQAGARVQVMTMD